MSTSVHPAGTDRVPVVLLHGWSGSAQTTWAPYRWTETLAARGFAPFALDLLGHGRAPAPHDPAQYRDIIEHTAGAIRHHGVVDVIGFSMGAKIALALAAREPGCFRRIVLSGVGENVFRQEKVGMVADTLEDGLSDVLPDQVRDLAAMAYASGNDLRALAACMRRESTPVTKAQLAAIDVPTLVAVGTLDPIAGNPQPLVDALPRSTLVRIPGVDHVGTPYARDFRSAAVAFLEESEDRP